MEELYILGNGFDLYLGLKTRYSDYFKNRKISEEFFEKIKSIFKNSIGSYNYDARTKVYAVFDYDENLLDIQIVQLYKDIEKNLFYLYLMFLKKCDLNWNEVESNILPFIRDTSKIFKLKMETILGNIEKNEMYKYDILFLGIFYYNIECFHYQNLSYILSSNKNSSIKPTLGSCPSSFP